MKYLLAHTFLAVSLEESSHGVHAYPAFASLLDLMFCIRLRFGHHVIACCCSTMRGPFGSLQTPSLHLLQETRSWITERRLEFHIFRSTVIRQTPTSRLLGRALGLVFISLSNNQDVLPIPSIMPPLFIFWPRKSSFIILVSSKISHPVEITS